MSVDFPQPEGALITMKRGFMAMAVDSIPQANGKWRMKNEGADGYFLRLAVTTSAQWSVASGAAITLRERTSMRSAWAVSTMI